MADDTKTTQRHVGRFSTVGRRPGNAPVITKTETLDEYRARGGKVRRLPTGERLKMTNTMWMDASKTPVVMGR